MKHILKIQAALWRAALAGTPPSISAAEKERDALHANAVASFVCSQKGATPALPADLCNPTRTAFSLA